jgi:hypothetical protein
MSATGYALHCGLSLHIPHTLVFIPIDLHHLGVQLHVLFSLYKNMSVICRSIAMHHPTVPFCKILKVFLDLRSRGVIMSPIGIRIKRVCVHRGGNVTSHARIGVLKPSSSKVMILFVKNKIKGAWIQHSVQFVCKTYSRCASSGACHPQSAGFRMVLI